MPDGNDMDAAVDDLIERLALRGEVVPTRKAAARMIRAASALKDALVGSFRDMPLDEIRAWEAAAADEIERRG